ncbi:MAG: hypothetical protein J6Y01_07490, partial [Spirochaetales bacterium]|nr:hypothetical protein [Spirochaetales bacterium]
IEKLAEKIYCFFAKNFNFFYRQSIQGGEAALYALPITPPIKLYFSFDKSHKKIYNSSIIYKREYTQRSRM